MTILVYDCHLLAKGETRGNEEERWDDDTEIDPEVWLQALLAMTGDKECRAELI